MIDPVHARQHIAEARRALEWLRSLPPAGPRYKVWLGDVMEVARAVFGPENAALAEPRAVLARHARLTADSDVTAYLALLDEFAVMLDGWHARVPEPIPLITLAPPAATSEPGHDATTGATDEHSPTGRRDDGR